MSYAYIPRTSKCQEETKLFFADELFDETFGIFNRLFRDIEIHNEGVTKKTGEKALAAKQTRSRDAVLKWMESRRG